MNGLITLDAHAKTDAIMFSDGYLCLSSNKLTMVSGRKHNKKHINMVSIIAVRRVSSRSRDDGKPAVLAGACLLRRLRCLRTV